MPNSDYLDSFLSGPRLQEAVEQAQEILKHFEFCAIAFTGNSGCLIAAPLAVAMGKELIMVRKTTTNTHACGLVEGSGRAVSSYVIVDDFVCSGKTIKRVVRNLYKYNLDCVGYLECMHPYAKRKTIQVRKNLVVENLARLHSEREKSNEKII